MGDPSFRVYKFHLTIETENYGHIHTRCNANFFLCAWTNRRLLHVFFPFSIPKGVRNRQAHGISSYNVPKTESKSISRLLLFHVPLVKPLGESGEQEKREGVRGERIGRYIP